MTEGGRILADVRNQLASTAKEGIILKDLDNLAERLIKKAGALPAFLGYRPEGTEKSYSASICTSVNNVVVHGLPNDYKLKNGDLLKIDLGVLYKEFYTDTAITIGIGKISSEAERLIAITKKSLEAAIENCQLGKSLGDISWAIGNCVKGAGFKVVKGLTGHGIGRQLHEDPVVYNEGKSGMGKNLEVGMVLAIEPMVSAGSSHIIQLSDESYATSDKSLSAHFEHTVAITASGPEILTR